MKYKNQAFKLEQGKPKPVMQRISTRLSISSHIYEVIREGILVGFTNRFIAENLKISSYIIELCRINLVNQGLIKKSSYGSRINAYKPVTLYTYNHKGEQIEIPNFFSKFWNIGPSNPTVDPSSFQLPIVTEKDLLTNKGKPVPKYLISDSESIEAITETIEAEEVESDAEVTIVPVNGPIDTKTDFITLQEQTTLRVAKKPLVKSLEELELFTMPETPQELEKTIYDVVEVTPTALVLTPKQNKMHPKSAISAISEISEENAEEKPTDKATDKPSDEPVTITLKGIKFILNLKASEVTITDNSIEIK